MTTDKKACTLYGKTMAYVDRGDGPPVVFLHGNPASSYLWRNILPFLESEARCIAPDLIGMGDSDKLDHSGPDSYRFIDHRRYLEALIEELVPGDPVTFVVHDWGSALAFDWANRHRDRVRGIAYTEALVCPLTWADWPAEARDIFRTLRSDAGEALVLEENAFVERILPAAVLHPLDTATLAEYRRPFAEPGEGRRPTLSWPRELPLDGEPADVTEIVEEYAAWMAENTIPKLFINAEPGAILTGAPRETCRAWPNQREVTVSASHFVPEDAPDAMGQALRDWFRTLNG